MTFAPYIFRSDNYGRSWSLLTDGTNGIPDDYPVRVVREDPDREGLLYAGTEFGLFVSFDDGDKWQSLQQNLPVTPVTDMRVQHQDLILSTQGRSFWILDDITPLHELDEQVSESNGHLFQPRDAYRVNDRGGSQEYNPQPKPHGVLLHYYIADSTEVSLEILDAGGQLITSYSTDSTKAKSMV